MVKYYAGWMLKAEENLHDEMQGGGNIECSANYLWKLCSLDACFLLLALGKPYKVAKLL